MSVSTNVFQRNEPEHGIPDYRAEPKDCGKRLKVLAGVSFTGSEDKRWRYIQRFRQRRATKSRESTLRDWAAETPPPVIWTVVVAPSPPSVCARTSTT